jgi:hypothetical protein
MEPIVAGYSITQWKIAGAFTLATMIVASEISQRFPVAAC